mgnify:CR=1 FL=1
MTKHNLLHTHSYPFIDTPIVNETILGEEETNYIHPNNHELMSDLDKNGNERFWIYEIHLVDEELEIGGFFEQLVS